MEGDVCITKGKDWIRIVVAKRYAVERYRKRATWSGRGTFVFGHMLCQVYTVGVAELFLGGNVRTQRVLMRFTSYKFKNYVDKLRLRLRALLVAFIACRRRGEGQLLDDAAGDAF